MHELDWRGCYQDNLTGKIHPDAFAHRAKMAWGLARRIFEHLFERGWLKTGDLVADPFGGIGVTGLVAASFGCPCILVELEEKFVALADKSFELHYDAWEKMGKPRPIILQGDSRNFSSIIREAVGSVITSPPFLATEGGCNPRMGGIIDEAIMGRHAATHKRDKRYGTTQGQIGAMKEGKQDEVVAVITSPPYAESLQPETEEQTRRKQERIAKAKTIHDGRALEKPSPGKAALGGGYGVSEGQLGAMKEGDFEEVKAIITSPVYGRDTEPHGDIHHREGSELPRRGYGQAPGQIGAMKEGDFEEVKAVITSPPYAHIFSKGHQSELGDKKAEPACYKSLDVNNLGNLPEGDHEAVVNGIVTSPPFEDSMSSDISGIDFVKAKKDYPGRVWHEERVKQHKVRMDAQSYGGANGQIGQERGGTYWGAVSEVYQECFKALKLNGIIVVVVKDFVRKKKRVPLCDQTLELLQAIGFKPLERIRAWLVESEYPTTLFSEEDEHHLYEAHERERRAKYEARAVTAKAEARQLSAYRPHTFDGWLAAWRQKKKASFFRRDAEIKGSPRIDWEEVLICQKVD